MQQLSRLALALVLVVAPAGLALAQANAYRGLWVGQVTLSRATEVTVPLDENNVPVAPNPAIPTPTTDEAHLRLILHVNGAGQVSLLKDVAVLDRSGGTNSSAVGGSAESEGQLALVTDDRLYGEFPPQPAVRYGSVVFDFGDSRTTDGLTEIVNQAANAAAASVEATTQDLSTTAGRLAAETAAQTAAAGATAPVVANADVSEAFETFLRDSFSGDVLDGIATNANPSAAAASARLAATNVQNRSFYRDARAVSMVEAVVQAVQAAGSSNAKKNAAHSTASSFADIANDYQRFTAGRVFSDMIVSAAAAAANAAVLSGATEARIRAAVEATNAVVVAREESLRVKVARYGYRDTRAPDAVNTILDAVVAKAVSALPAGTGSRKTIRTEAEAAGRLALANQVPRVAVSLAPTLDYTAFVRSNTFQNSAQVAAQAAAQGAVSERKNNLLFTPDSLKRAGRDAALAALQGTFGVAARAARTELPMTGTFGPGQGDPRFRGDIKPGDPALGPAALTGTIELPASHPTNPFRHRRHPDHAVGLDITRLIRLDFDGQAGDALARAGYGVDRIAGTYREEVFGLHKPLGPAQDQGLRIEGKFELNRISLIDTLNAR